VAVFLDPSILMPLLLGIEIAIWWRVLFTAAIDDVTCAPADSRGRAHYWISWNYDMVSRARSVPGTLARGTTRRR